MSKSSFGCTLCTLCTVCTWVSSATVGSTPRNWQSLPSNFRRVRSTQRLGLQSPLQSRTPYLAYARPPILPFLSALPQRPPSPRRSNFLKRERTVARSEAGSGGAALPNPGGGGRALIDVLWKRFRADWKAYCLIPIIAAFIGWFTNWVAVKMIFYPMNFWGLPIFVIPDEPLGFLGWRGIVPAKTAKMSGDLVNMVTTHLLDVNALFSKLNPHRIAQLLSPEMDKIVGQVASDMIAPAPGVLQSCCGVVGKAISVATLGMSGFGMRFIQRAFARGLVRNMQAAVPMVLDLKESVVTTMCSDRSLLVNLFQLCGKVELEFLVNSGLWVGFLLGVIQMAFWLVWQQPWTLTFGGLVVGLLTNWIALKLIFEPVEPVQVGPFSIQGMFQQRRVEISGDFSECFSDTALTSERIWNSIFTGPQASGFAKMLHDNVCSITHKATMGLGLLIPGSFKSTISEQVLEKLPDHIHVLHEYIDQTLDIKNTLRGAMSKMSAQQFERVLHPIFEEDELTLILVGGFLGAVAGFGQQVLEMQKLGTLPKSWERWIPFLGNKTAVDTEGNFISSSLEKVTAFAAQKRDLLMHLLPAGKTADTPTQPPGNTTTPGDSNGKGQDPGTSPSNPTSLISMDFTGAPAAVALVVLAGCGAALAVLRNGITTTADEAFLHE